MNLIDRVVGWISPQRGFARQAWRDALRHYDAGDDSRLNANWRAINTSAEQTDRYSRDTLFNSPTIQTTDNTQAVNPLYRYGLQQVEDPEINRLAGAGAAPWFMLGATEDTAFIEVDYLNGDEVPKIRRMETAGQLGFVWDIYLDWGIQVMDYRGAVKNPGIKIENTLLA